MNLITFLHITLESGFALFCILAAIYIHLFDHEERKTVKVVTYGLLTNAVINIADTLAYFYHGNPSRTGFYMVRISNFIVFVGMFVLLAFANMLLDKVLEEKGEGKDKQLRNIVYALSGAGVTLLTVSALFGILYTFDEQNAYHRGPAYILIPLFAVIAIAVMLVRTVKERAHLSKNEFRVFLCLYLLPVAGATAQIFFYGISLANIANSVAFLIMVKVFVKDIIAGISVKRSFILSGESIERISADLDRFLEGTGTEWQNRIRIRFTVEEALLCIWEHFGKLTMARVTAGIKFGKPSIRIEHEGEAFNPFSKTESTHEEWSSGLLASAGLSPTYSYAHETNIIKISMGRMRINPVITVLVAILFGLISGSVAMITLSEGDAAFVTQDLLVPVYDLWNNILYSVSAPAMFIIVMSTMLDTREVSEQGGNAGIITGRYFVVSILTGIFTIIPAMLLSGERVQYNAFSRYVLSDLIKDFFSIVPENLMDPFKDFNTAQLILMGIVFAYATMAVGQQAGGLVSLIHQLNMVSTQVAQWIANLMPFFTVFLTAELVLGNDAQILLSMLTIIPFAIIVSLLIMLVVLLYISRRSEVSPVLLLKKLWPSFVLTLRTGQVADSYALAEKACIRDLGIQRIYTQKVLPLGLVLYMPVSIVGMISFVMYAAIRSGIAITPVWILTAIIFSLILLVAAPPIPGVNLLSYVVIMGQLGIGKEYVIAAMIFDLIFSMFGSAANQMMLQMDMLLQAERVGLLKHNTLNRKVSAQEVQ